MKNEKKNSIAANSANSYCSKKKKEKQKRSEVE